jgi:hypothetical protein
MEKPLNLWLDCYFCIFLPYILIKCSVKMFLLWTAGFGTSKKLNLSNILHGQIWSVSNQNGILRHCINEILDCDSTYLRVIFCFKHNFEDFLLFLLLLLIFWRCSSLWSFVFFTAFLYRSLSCPFLYRTVTIQSFSLLILNLATLIWSFLLISFRFGEVYFVASYSIFHIRYTHMFWSRKYSYTNNCHYGNILIQINTIYDSILFFLQTLTKYWLYIFLKIFQILFSSSAPATDQLV